MAKAKAKVTAKIKKKFWYPILAPKIFNNSKIGEIYLTEAAQATGRSFWHGLKDLSENMRDQNVYLCFKIKNALNNSLNTEIIGYRLTPTSIKKMVRRNNDRSDDSFIVLTSDNRKVRIKTLILTAHKTKHSNSTRLKNAMIKKLTEEVKKINFGNLVDKLISHKLQMEIKKFLTKIYPVKAFQVKFMGLDREKIPGQEEPEEAVEEAVEEIKEEPKKTVKKAVKEVEEKVVEKTVEKVVEKEEKVPEEKAEKAAEELVEEKE